MRSLIVILLLCAGSATFAADALSDTNDVRGWLTNTFRRWLTRSYPEVTSKYYPDWFENHPAGLEPAAFTNWLAEVFPDLDTEMYPTWMENYAPEALGTNIPPWWDAVLRGRFTVSPAARQIPSIVRGPYLQMATTNSMVVRWRTDIPTSSTVLYGRSTRRLDRTARANGVFTEHAVLVTNLSSASTYYYTLGTVDTPLIVHWTNHIAFVSSTNGRMYVSKPATREQIAVASRPDTFVFSLKDNRFVVSDAEQSFTANTTNTVLAVNSPNNTVLLTASNGTIVIATSNTVRWLTGPQPGAGGGLNFVVGTTNVLHAGRDSNTFFVTHPPIGTQQPTRVWVLGDPGTRKKAQRDVRNAYYKWTGERHTDLILTLGDNAYTSGKDSEYQGSIFLMYDDIMRKTVMWPSLGNHDAGSANSPIQFGVYYDIFTLPSLGQAGGVMSGTEAYYSFDYANIHFVCIDSADSDWAKNGLMLKWLKADLAANKQDWLVAYCHHPPYTKGSHDSDRDRDSEARMRYMREVVAPVLEDHGLDLMLTGHSHAYERSYLMDGMYERSTNINEAVHFKSVKDGRKDGSGIYVKPSRGPTPHEGAVYVVAGSSGQTSGGGLQHSVSAISLNVLGSLVLDFDGHRVDATFIDEKANVRDYFTILKGGPEAEDSGGGAR